MLKDEEKISSLTMTSNKLYFKDLGPQVGWTTVSKCLQWNILN